MSTRSWTERAPSWEVKWPWQVKPGQWRAQWVMVFLAVGRELRVVLSALPASSFAQTGLLELNQEGEIWAVPEPVLDSPVLWAGLCAPALMNLASVPRPWPVPQFSPERAQVLPSWGMDQGWVSGEGNSLSTYFLFCKTKRIIPMSWTGYEAFLRGLMKCTYYTPSMFAKCECLCDDEDGDDDVWWPLAV